MAKYIAIPFPLLEAVRLANNVLQAFETRGLELGLSDKVELPWPAIQPRSYKWVEDGNVIRFTLWGGGNGFYVSGTIAGTDSHNGTYWTLESLKIRYNAYIGGMMSKTVLHMDEQDIMALNYANDYGNEEYRLMAKMAIDRELLPVEAAVRIAVENQRQVDEFWASPEGQAILNP